MSYFGSACVDLCILPLPLSPLIMNATQSDLAFAHSMIKNSGQWPPYSNIYDAVTDGYLVTMTHEELVVMSRIGL